MNNARRYLSAAAGGALVLSLSLVAHADEVPLPPGTTRLAGDNRYETSAAVSAASFTAPVDAVFVATGAQYADALAAGPVASRLGGPVLLVQQDHIPSAVRKELQQLQPTTIYVLGGSGVVSSAVTQDLAGYAERVQRLSGANRYETAVAASQEAWDESTTVFLASGEQFADALAGGAAAATREAPLLLTPSGNLSGATRAELVRLDPEQVFVLGGPAAVGAGVVEQVQAAVPAAAVNRLSGKNRYETAAKVADTIWPNGSEAAFFATGLEFADALSGTPAAAVNSAPLLLTKQDCLPGVVYEARTALSPSRTGILGGSSVVSTAGATQECGSYRYSGSGDDVVKISKPGRASDPVIVTATHSGSGHFAIWGLGSGQKKNDLLVNTIGHYQGRTLLDAAVFDQKVTSTHLEISANGPWTVEIRSLGTARTMSTNRTTGAGDDVLQWNGTGAIATIKHNAAGHVGVWAREADGDYLDLLVNTIGPYHGTVTVPAGTRVVTLEGEGTWSIEVD